MQISLPGKLSTFESYSQTAWRQKRNRQLEKGSENVVCRILLHFYIRKGNFSKVHVEMGGRDRGHVFDRSVKLSWLRSSGGS